MKLNRALRAYDWGTIMCPLTRLVKSTLCSLTAAGLLLLPTVPAAATSVVVDPLRRCDLASADQIERWFDLGLIMPISSYDDDPTVREAVIECVPTGDFWQVEGFGLALWNSRVWMADEDFVYRENRETGEFTPFAWNPWPVIPTPNADGSFRFPDEPRFPLFVIERGPDGKPILRDGLQVWAPLPLHQGATTTFEAANKVKDAAEDWSGRYLHWGDDGYLIVNAHSFIDFNAFYSPSARQLFFGVVPYRLFPGDAVRVFESATSWEIAAHEAGHAVHHTLKPNMDVSNTSIRTWGESFADQMAMWTSLRDPGRARALIGDAGLGASNGLSRMGEAFGYLVGTGEPLRDAVNEATVSTTSPEVHDRSEVLTGALYRLFVSIYDDLSRQSADGLKEAGARMGIFLTRAADYTPENAVTLADVGKAHLKVDAELFGGRYRDRLVKEFKRREIFDLGSFGEWQAHEAALPKLRLPLGSGPSQAAKLLRQSLGQLGIGRDLGLIVQSVTRDERFRQTIVRVQLTHGRDAAATPLDNHGILVFRENGTLADYHAPVPPDGTFQAQALALLDQARELGLDRRGAPLSIVKKANGRAGVEARVVRGEGPSVWVDAYTLEAPHGERRDVVTRGWGSPRQTQRLERAGIILSDAELSR